MDTGSKRTGRSLKSSSASPLKASPRTLEKTQTEGNCSRPAPPTGQHRSSGRGAPLPPFEVGINIFISATAISPIFTEAAGIKRDNTKIVAQQCWAGGGGTLYSLLFQRKRTEAGGCQIGPSLPRALPHPTLTLERGPGTPWGPGPGPRIPWVPWQGQPVTKKGSVTPPSIKEG